MQISHEVPLALLEKSREFNDYDYCLVHLLEDNVEYFKFYQESIAMGRQVILDNSIFELEEAFDATRFAYWIEQLKPQSFIIPDVLDDYKGTIANCKSWIEKYSDLPGKTIGVVQGNTLDEALQCYRNIAPYVDKIAFSFNCKFYEDMFPNEEYALISWMKGRIAFMDYFAEWDHRIAGQPVHLLGAGLPQEYKHYKQPKFAFIDTMDTSNPIVHAINGIRYTEDGLEYKVKSKLIEYLHHTDFDMELINFNVTTFKSFVK